MPHSNDVCTNVTARRQEAGRNWQNRQTLFQQTLIDSFLIVDVLCELRFDVEAVVPLTDPVEESIPKDEYASDDAEDGVCLFGS